MLDPFAAGSSGADGEILINILWQYAKLFKKENTEAHRMRQDVEAFKVINIGRK